MLKFVSVPVSDDRARLLLGEYFAHRADGFPPEQGEYSVSYPDEDRFAAPHGLFLLALAYDDPIGCGGIRRLPDATTPTGETLVRFEVKHLWVRQTARGSGAGRALLAALETRARELGADQIVLDTNRSLSAAAGLYRSSGYRAIAPYNANPNATDWLGKLLGSGENVTGGPPTR